MREKRIFFVSVLRIVLLKEMVREDCLRETQVVLEG
jgi:hypothetical protein